MLRPITRLAAVSALSFGIVGSLVAFPAGSTAAKPVLPVAKAVVSPILDEDGNRTLDVYGPQGSMAIVTWPVLSDVLGAAIVLVSPEAEGQDHARFVAPMDAVLDLTLSVPGYADKSLGHIGASGATLTIGQAMKHRTDGGGR